MVAFYNGVTVLVENERATDVICLEFSTAFGIDKLLLGGTTFSLVPDETQINSVVTGNITNDRNHSIFSLEP